MDEYKSPNMYALKAKETQIKDSASDDDSTLNKPRNSIVCIR